MDDRLGLLVRPPIAGVATSEEKFPANASVKLSNSGNEPLKIENHQFSENQNQLLKSSIGKKTVWKFGSK